MGNPSIKEQIDYLERNKEVIMRLSTVTPALNKDIGLISSIQDNLRLLDKTVLNAVERDWKRKQSKKKKHED